VASGTVLARERAVIVEQLASICDAQARTEVRNPSKLDRIARGDLADKWAVMPGASAADPDVRAACGGKLERASVMVPEITLQSRPSLARMSSAVAVQANGRERAL